ncbi:MAG: DUF4421 family protein [Bacteroidaceae bacterium]|nr:DUF4421 family protein [Bacteroidaceae bacterium]
MKRALFYSCLMLMPLAGHAQLWEKARAFVDSHSKKANVDTLYIETPKEPWRISMDSYLSQSDLLMKSTVEDNAMFSDVEGNLECHPRIRTDVSSSVGVRVGYKGLAVHYAHNITGDKGRDLSVSGSGTWYCAHVRLHEFKTKEPQVRYEGKLYLDDDAAPEWMSFTNKWMLSSPIKAKTVVADGYYIFNKRRFSYKAAYRQSVIQRRSAGSWLAGAMFYYSDFRYDNNANAELLLYMNDVGRIKQWQANVGAGYGYNYVPAKGWLISAMAMPMVTVFNRVKSYHFDSNLRQLALDEEEHDIDELQPQDYRISSMGSESMNSRISLNFNARLSITYNWNRYFVNLNGQFYNFNYRHHGNRGRLNDWYANASIGVRL